MKRGSWKPKVTAKVKQVAKRAREPSAEKAHDDEPYIDADGNLIRPDFEFGHTQEDATAEQEVVEEEREDGNFSKKQPRLEWEYAEGLKGTSWKCNACKQTFTGGVTRIRYANFLHCLFCSLC